MRRPWASYLVAILAVGIALALRESITPWLGFRVPFITVFGAVIVAAWFGGFVAALLAAALGWLGTEWLFIQPRWAISLRGAVCSNQ